MHQPKAAPPNEQQEQGIKSQSGKNLSQYLVDNPPGRAGTMLIGDFLILGDANTAVDVQQIRQNQISHIINLAPKVIRNRFDASELKQAKNTDVEAQKLCGKIQYLTVNNWTEHKMPSLDNLEMAK